MSSTKLLLLQHCLIVTVSLYHVSVTLCLVSTTHTGDCSTGVLALMSPMLLMRPGFYTLHQHSGKTSTTLFSILNKRKQNQTFWTFCKGTKNDINLKIFFLHRFLMLRIGYYFTIVVLGDSLYQDESIQCSGHGRQKHNVVNRDDCCLQSRRIFRILTSQ